VRTAVLDALEEFHRQQPLRPGMSREELRGRAGAVDDRLFTYLLAAMESEGLVRAERDKVRLATYELRLSAEQQQILDQVEAEFRRADAAPPSADEALGHAGIAGGDDEHELFQLLLESKKLVRVKEALFFHAESLASIQERLIDLLRERKEIGPGDIKDLLGISRKYAIPLLEYFDSRGVTRRVGERRVLRAP
jgi:selenocysteine-specific elongation factor